MRKFIYLLAIPALFATNKAEAQFAVQHDTVSVAAYAYTDVYNNITNHKNDTSRISWRIIYQNMPQSWKDSAAFGMCDNVTCYPISILGGSTQTSDTIGAHKTMLFKIQINPSSTHVTPTTSGPIYLSVELADGTQTDTITFALNKWSTNVAKLGVDKDEVSLYPNPANDEINITYPKEAGVRMIAVYNLVGKQINAYRPTGVSGAKLNLENMPAGIYLVRLIDVSGKVVATRRFTHQ